MARPRTYTAAKLRKAVNEYFDSITRERAATELVDSGKRDDKGHVIYEPAAILNKRGETIMLEEFIIPPSVADLCAFLKIHRATWANYANHELHPELREVTEEVYERMKAWNERELLTRPGKDIKGIVFNLQANYGYGGEKAEIELGEGARKVMASASMAERKAMLDELMEKFRAEREEA
ncbi:MAG: hypothetical protein SPK76_08405 [Bacteroidales bacterium]|nr:hypothetical protein [Bacteroidales bacterium]